MAQNLFQLARIMKKIGVQTFGMRYRKPVLVWIGSIGDISSVMGSRGGGGTFIAEIQNESPANPNTLGTIFILDRKYNHNRSVPVTIGRAQKNDIIIPDFSISKIHAGFLQYKKAMYVVDLNSHNGTFLRQTRLPPKKPVQINDQEEVVLGRLKFEYLSPSTFLERVENTAYSNRKDLSKQP